MTKKLVKGFSFVAAVALLVVGVSVSAQTATFTRDLTLKSTGADVVALQDILIAGGYLTIPAGVSKGYFGQLTANAVMAWQAKMGLPATGYFGPMSRAAIGTPSTGGNTGGTTTGDLQGGDGDFNDFDVLGDPSSEDVEEGEEDVNVLGFEFEADDSDLRVERLDVTLEGTGDEKPWKYIEEMKLFYGDDEVASVDASDKDEWDEIGDSDVYEITFSDIDTVVEEGEKAEFYVSVTAVDSNDDLPITWYISIQDNGLRATNAEGIDVYAGDYDNDDETFTQEVATEGEVDIKVDDDENEDKTVEVDDDSETDEVVLYTATVESDENDNLIEEVGVRIESGTAGLGSIIKTLYLIIDGDEVKKESVSTTSTAATTTFDDLEVELGEDEEVTVEIVADIRETDDGDNYVAGETLQVTAMDMDFVDEQDDDVTVFEGTDGGEITLSTSSVMVELSSVSEPVNIGGDEAKGKFVIKFNVTAPEDEDIYIPLASATTSFDIIDAETGATTTATTSSATLTGGTVTSSMIKISEGQTKTVTLTVNLDNTNGGDRSLKIGLTEVSYKVGSTGAATTTYTSGLDEDFETDPLLLLNANVTN